MDRELSDKPTPRRRFARPWLWVSLLAAATAIWLSQRPATVEVADLLLAPYPTSGTQRGWIAQIRLDDDGYPLLVHVDADGWPVILYPEQRLGRLSHDSALLLPDPARGVTWSWPEPVDPEDLLAAATSQSSLDLRALGDHLRRVASRAPSADEARARVRELLEEEVGPVRSARLLPTASQEIAGQT